MLLIHWCLTGSCGVFKLTNRSFKSSGRPGFIFMRDAFIYDHLRTPRGRGRPDGALHAVPPVSLAAQVLSGLVDRGCIPGEAVDDVVLGCVAPVGE